MRTAFIPAISLVQSAAGAVGVVDVVGFCGVGAVELGSVVLVLVVGVVGCVEVLLVVILLVLLFPCGVVIWANAPAANIRVRAITRKKAPAITLIVLTPFGLTSHRKTLARSSMSLFYDCI